MAKRRSSLQTLTLIRHYTSSTIPPSPNPSLIKTLTPKFQALALIKLSQIHPQIHRHHISPNISSNHHTQFNIYRHFSSNNNNNDKGNDSDNGEHSEEEKDDIDDDVDDDDDDDDDDDGRDYSLEERESEAAAIGYKVIGPLQPEDRIFKDYEPIFAVIQIGSHQFKVSNGDCIYVERLKFCEVHDKIILNKVLLLGSTSQTLIGRPAVPDATVHAIVEEHALDAKVIIFKKKRRKNYRRTKGHRQELTKLRITGIHGIEKPENPVPEKTKKMPSKKVEKVAVVA